MELHLQQASNGGAIGAAPPNDSSLEAPPSAPNAGLGALVAALAKAKLGFKRITPKHTARIDSEKGSYTYGYADLADLIDATVEALSTNGLAIVQPLDVSDGILWVWTKLLHVEGAELVSHYPIAPLERLAGLRPQALGSLVTYGRRYAYGSMLGIAALAEDDDAQAAETAPGPDPAFERGARSAPRKRTAKASAPKTAPAAVESEEDLRAIRALFAAADEASDRLNLPRDGGVRDFIKAWCLDLGLGESTKGLNASGAKRLRDRLRVVTLEDCAKAKRKLAQAGKPEEPPPPAEGPAPADGEPFN